MINSIEKAKIPSRYSFVLKTEQLENLLRDNNINTHVDLHYWFLKKSDRILEAHYLLPNDSIQYCRLSITAGTVLKKDLCNARKKMEEIALPEFASWIKSVLALPNNSPLLKNALSFEAVYQNEEIIIKAKL